MESEGRFTDLHLKIILQEAQFLQGYAWQLVQRGHSVANGLPVITVNRTGQEDDPTGVTKGIKFWGTPLGISPIRAVGCAPIGLK